ncbi:MAG: macro domain-containing protein [Planctomycetes bacterium]|nr:macro domain-containing protein [Planctomycetota bacterium]NOG54077.1 macro domain-containing protein [Planctomycetota bacterium]
MSATVRFTHQSEGGLTLEVVQGDLTAEAVDAIVNAANEQLAHGGGVAGVISRRGGPVIEAESRAWVDVQGPVETGSAAITSGGDLPARYVIHAVGPIWGTGDEDAKLASAIRAALQLADENRLGSMSFPAISSGIFGFPKDRCARVFLDTIEDYRQRRANGAPGSITSIRLCNIDDETASLFEQAARDRYEAV